MQEMNKEAFALSHRIESVSDKVNQVQCAIRLYSMVDDDLGNMPNALALFGSVLDGVQDELQEVAEKVRSLRMESEPAEA